MSEAAERAIRDDEVAKILHMIRERFGNADKFSGPDVRDAIILYIKRSAHR